MRVIIAIIYKYDLNTGAIYGVHTLNVRPPFLRRGCAIPKPAFLSTGCPRAPCAVLVSRGRPPRIHLQLPHHLRPPHVLDMRLHLTCVCECVSVCKPAFSTQRMCATAASHPRAAAYQDTHKGNAYGVTDHGEEAMEEDNGKSCRTSPEVTHGTLGGWAGFEPS